MGIHAGELHGRVLVMDDDPFILEVASDMLSFLGFEVEVAREGSEAIDLYSRAKASGQAFDAVIMDLTVDEGMDGIETIQHLRSVDPQVKALVSSGNSNAPGMADYQDTGFVGVIAKPYQLEELATRLRDIIAVPH